MTTASRTSVVRFSGPLSRQVNGPAPGDLVDQINAYFATNPSILLRDATVFARGMDEKSYGLSATLMVQLPGNVVGSPMTPFGFPYTARYLAGGVDTLDQQTNALLALGPLYGRLLPLSGIRPSRLEPVDWILIYANLSGLNLNGMGNPMEPAIGAPIAPIAAGATGGANLWNTRGLQLPGVYSVRNLSFTIPWVANDRNYVYWDWKFGGLVGMPACGAAAALTTSTSTGPV